MIGAIIGDIVGSRFEWNNYRKKDFTLFTEDCFATDDSIMSLAIAGAVLQHQTEAVDLSKAAVCWMQKVGRPYPHCGFGGNFYHWIYSDDPKPYNSFGNGAAMRVSACGLSAKTLEAALQMSTAVTAVTHNHPEGIKGANATTAAIFLAKSGASKDAIRTAISVGGDSDTLAAITGSIAEAYYGIPKDLYDTAVTYLDEPLKQILFAFESVFGSNLQAE